MKVKLLINGKKPKSKAETSFGGNPVKLAKESFKWPTCTTCALPMQFLGKIADEENLYQIFMCQNDPGCCDEWDPDEGGNAVVVTPRGALEKVEFPSDGIVSRDIEYGAVVVEQKASDYDQARIKWAEKNKKEEREILGQFYGAPQWLQGDETPKCDSCGSSMTLLAQLEEGPDYATAMNFGGSGSAYLFTCNCSKTAKFLWQC